MRARINYDELLEDFKKLAEVGWDCRCGAGWYNIDESEKELWRIICKYGFMKDDTNLNCPTKYYLWGDNS